MTHRNAPRLNATPVFMSEEKAAGGDDLPVMQDGTIHWNGQPIAVVLAETQAEADHAMQLIKTTYDAEPAMTDFGLAKAKGGTQSQFMGQPLHNEIGRRR